MWLSHPSFFRIIREVWHRNINGSNMFRLWKKIEAAKRGIKEVDDCRCMLTSLQSNPLNELLL